VLWTGTPAAAQPAEVREALPAASLAGAGRLRYWGFDVYDANLWVAPGFSGNDFAAHAFALELAYLRDFTNDDIASRSLDEMRRFGPIADGQAAQWQQALRAAFPDVKKSDRITGINRPREGVVFLTNGRVTGAVRDTEFARLFFGIWLSPRTSEPKLRQQLLGQAGP
jgi:hypothetical protein